MSEPIPMLLWCPQCCERHIDEGEFVTKPHATHACQFCGLLWKPALVDTFGVRFLPYCKEKSVAEVAKELTQEAQQLDMYVAVKTGSFSTEPHNTFKEGCVVICTESIGSLQKDCLYPVQAVDTKDGDICIGGYWYQGKRFSVYRTVQQPAPNG